MRQTFIRGEPIPLRTQHEKSPRYTQHHLGPAFLRASAVVCLATRVGGLSGGAHAVDRQPRARAGALALSASAPSTHSVFSSESSRQHLPGSGCLTFLLVLHEGVWQ